MSSGQNDNHWNDVPLYGSSPRVAHREARAPKARVGRRGPEQSDDEEALMVARYFVGLLLLGIGPLIAFLGAYYFMPDLFVFLGGARAF